MAETNSDFNFEEFATSAISYIDSKRSYNRGTYVQESRINAFYRLLGLPASVIVETDEDKRSSRRIDQLNNGNSFNKTSGLDYKTYKSDFEERQNSFLRPIEEGEEEAFLDNKRTSIDASIQTESSNARKRGILFPLIVDGKIFINPQTRRISEAFVSSTNLKRGYTRPLIENIIYIRLKIDNVVDTTSQGDVSAAFQVNFDLRSLGDSALTKLNNTINNIPGILVGTVNRLSKARKATGSNVVWKVANIADQSPEVVSSDTASGSLDEKNAKIENKKAINNAVLALFEYNDIIGGSNSRSLFDTALTNILLSVINPSDGEAQKEEQAVTEEVAKAREDIKEQAKVLDLLFGEFSGLSGIDILVVITAMFKIEEKYLLGLLNDQSYNNLKEIKGDSLPSKAGVSESIDKLKEEITTIFGDLVEKTGITGVRSQSTS